MSVKHQPRNALWKKTSGKNLSTPNPCSTSLLEKELSFTNANYQQNVNNFDQLHPFYVIQKLVMFCFVRVDRLSYSYDFSMPRSECLVMIPNKKCILKIKMKYQLLPSVLILMLLFELWFRRIICNFRILSEQWSQTIRFNWLMMNLFSNSIMADLIHNFSNRKTSKATYSYMISKSGIGV